MPAHEQEDAVFDPAREWAVYRCAHGCLHVALDRVMLTLTADEFHALQQLMNRACARFHGDAGTTIRSAAHLH